MPSTKNNPAVAGVDLGSNSFRLLIARPMATTLQPLVKELRTVRLAEGLQESGAIGAPAWARGLDALREFHHLLADHAPSRVRACGTAALRLATNRTAFCQAAGEILACPIEVLSGSQEAALSLRGVLSGFPTPPSAPCLVIDVGGGSTECIAVPDLGEGQQSPNLAATSAVSLPIGAVNLTESFVAHPGPQALQPLALRARSAIIPATYPIGRPATLIGTGGTATALAALDLKLKKYDDSLVHGHILTKIRLQKLIVDLAPLSTEERNRLPGLDRGRGEIVLAGAIIFLELLNHFAATELLVSDSGLLEGIWLSAQYSLPTEYAALVEKR